MEINKMKTKAEKIAELKPLIKDLRKVENKEVTRLDLTTAEVFKEKGLITEINYKYPHKIKRHVLTPKGRKWLRTFQK